MLVNEFNSVMEDVVNEVLGDADPNDRVMFAILSSNFDRALNSTYQPRSEVTGVAIAELFGKMLQSNQSIDIDNDLTLHVQRVNLPRGNGLKRKLAVNMGLNLLRKSCVFTAARQYDDVPCFGYAMALAIMLKDHNFHYANFPFTNKRNWTEFTIFLTLLISRMAPWTLLSTPNLSPSSPKTTD